MGQPGDQVGVTRLAPGGNQAGARLPPGGARLPPGGARLPPGGARLPPAGAMLVAGGRQLAPGGCKMVGEGECTVVVHYPSSGSWLLKLSFGNEPQTS